jgi:Rhomboid-like protein
MSPLAGVRWRAGRVMFRRYAFAWAYLGCYLAAELAWVLLTPRAQATLTAWASTSVADLEHEPVGPLVLSAFVGPGNLLIWPVLIALAVFGASRALGNGRTMLVCVAGHVIGSLVSEGIVAYRVDAGQLPAADRYLTDVGPSYVVASAIVIAAVCGTWLARAAAALDFAVLVIGGRIFGGLSHLDVSAVGHLTALVTATAAVTLTLARRHPARPEAVATPTPTSQAMLPGLERPRRPAPGSARFPPPGGTALACPLSPGRCGRPAERPGPGHHPS